MASVRKMVIITGKEGAGKTYLVNNGLGKVLKEIYGEVSVITDNPEEYPGFEVGKIARVTIVDDVTAPKFLSENRIDGLRDVEVLVILVRPENFVRGALVLTSEEDIATVDLNGPNLPVQINIVRDDNSYLFVAKMYRDPMDVVKFLKEYLLD